MSNQRKFAKKLLSNANAASAVQDDGVKSYMHHLIPLNNILDLTKPVDYENFLIKNKLLFGNDPNRELVIIPHEDVKSESIPRHFRTLNSSVPENYEEIYLDNQLAKQCISFYKSNWSVIGYRLDKYGGSFQNLPRKKENQAPPVLPEQKYEVDLDDVVEDNILLNLPPSGAYHEEKLAVCSQSEYKSFLNAIDSHLASNGGPGKFLSSSLTTPILKDYSLKQIPDGTWVLSEAKPAMNTSSIYLQCASKTSELGENWIMLHMQDSEFYLYTGGKIQNQKWMDLLSKALEPQNRSASLRSNSSLASFDSIDTLNFTDIEYDSVRLCLQRYNQESESIITQQRSKDRMKILTLYPEIRMDWERSSKTAPNDSIPKLPLGFPLRPEGCRRYLVQFHKLRVGLQISVDSSVPGIVSGLDNPEPFFLSACLIHLTEGRRISEDFYWDPNSSQISRMLPSKLFLQRPEHENLPNLVSSLVDDNLLRRCCSCIFTTAYPEEEVYILLRVDKVLQGSIGGCADKYIKSGSTCVTNSQDAALGPGDQKVAQTLNKTMKSFCEKVGHYRQPFAWSARPLAERNLSMRFYRHDSSKLSEEDLIKNVLTLSRSRPVVPLQCSMTVKEYRNSSDTSHINAVVSPQLIPVMEDSSSSQANSGGDNSAANAKHRFDRQWSLFKSAQELIREIRPFLGDGLGSGGSGGGGGSFGSGVVGSNNERSATLGNGASLMNPSGGGGGGGNIGSFNNNMSSMHSSHGGSHHLSLSSDNRISHDWDSLTSDVSGRHGVVGAGNNGISGGELPKSKFPEALVCPYLEYENILYVYPKSLNYSKQNAFPKARNLACFVEVRDNDSETAKPLKVIYSRANIHQSAFHSWANTSVSHHDFSPSFHDEIKICLHTAVTNKHHLLFRFYHVSCETAKNEKLSTSNNRSLENKVGFAWIPLLDRDGRFREGIFSLHIALDLPRANYLNLKEKDASVKWVEGPKVTFVGALRLQSSVYTNNRHMLRFFKFSHNYLYALQQQNRQSSASFFNSSRESQQQNTESNGTNRNSRNSTPTTTTTTTTSPTAYKDISDEGVECLKTLLAMDLCTILCFLPPFLNQLFQIIQCSASLSINRYGEVDFDLPIAKQAVNALIIIVSIVTGRGPDRPVLPIELYRRNKLLLKSYADNVFDIDLVNVSKSHQIFHCLARSLTATLMDDKCTQLVVHRLLANNWFFLDIINKSMVQFLTKSGKIKADRMKENRFSQSFQDDLAALLNKLTECIKNICLSSFSSSSSSSTTTTTMDSNNFISQTTSSSMPSNAQLSSIINIQDDVIEANCYLARFTARLFNIMDRGYVMNLIHNYMELHTKWDDKLKKVEEREKLFQLRYQYLQEICHHEHFVPLNLPSLCRNVAVVGVVGDSRNELFLTDHFAEHHYLAGLLLLQVNQRLTDTSLPFSGRVYREPIKILRNHLAKHTFDDRYISKNQQARLASLYLPLLSILIDHKRLFCLPGPHNNSTPANGGLSQNEVNEQQQHHQNKSATLSSLDSSRRNISASRPTSLHTLDNNSNVNLSQRGLDSLMNSNSSLVVSSNNSDRSSIGSSSTGPYLNKAGKVDAGVLEAIAGIGPGGSLQQRRRHRRTAGGSISSTCTITTDNTTDNTDGLSMQLSSDGSSICTVKSSNKEDGGSIIGVGVGGAAAAGAYSLNDNETAITPTAAPPLALLEDDDLIDDKPVVVRSTQFINPMQRRISEDDTKSTQSSGSWGAQVISAAGAILNGSAFHSKSNSSVAITNKTSTTNTLDRRLNSRTAAAPESSILICLPEKCQRDLFVSMLYIVNSITEDCLATWLKNITFQNRLEFLDLLILSIRHLSYQGKKSISNFNGISSSRVTSGQMSHKRMAPSKPGEDKRISSIDNENNNIRPALEGHLSTECGLIVLDVLSLFCNRFRTDLDNSTCDSQLFQSIIQIYLTFLRTCQSETLLKHMFPALRVFVNRYVKVLFSGNQVGNVLSDLCYEVLRCCNSRLLSTRTEACGFLYTLMLCSWNTLGRSGFNRVHIQIIIAVSRLVGNIDSRFEASLSHINMLAQRTFATESQRSNSLKERNLRNGTNTTNNNGSAPLTGKEFIEEVSDLTKRIRTVLMATAQMRQHQNDPEMLVDLQYSLAKSYASNPALRKTWLAKICQKHEEKNSFSEIAMVKLHIAALTAEFLHRRNRFDHGCTAFASISSNIPLEESGFREDSELSDVNYTLDDLKEELRQTAKALDKAGLYEVMPRVYRFLIPIYESERDLQGLASIYSDLASGYERAHKEEQSGHRLFAMYYRVTFYGQPFDHLNGKVYIYVANRCVELASFCDHLKSIFYEKYREKVELLMEAHVNRGLLDISKAYIQVTSVQPWFSEVDLQTERKTRFERNYELKYFWFETPFVPQVGKDNDSCLQGSMPKRTDDLSLQWKRRTILQTEMSFPHMRRRLEVVDVKEEDLSPIEGAEDALREKVQQLTAHLKLNEFSKLMDMHLQGALMVQVNQGPMAYAHAFLSPEARAIHPPENVKHLKLLFIQFLSTCLLLLNKYREVMPQQLAPKHQLMHATLNDYRVDLSNLLNEELIVDEDHLMVVSKSTLYMNPSLDSGGIQDIDSSL